MFICNSCFEQGLEFTLLIRELKEVKFYRNCGAALVGSSTRKFGFITRVDNVNWPP